LIYEVPSHFFLCAGRSEGYSPLNAFDQALLAAGVGDTNLVRMSSILPPRCRQVEAFSLPGGALVPVAYAKMGSSTPGQVIASAVAIGVPEDPSLPGLIMEHHGQGSLDEILSQVREMAIRGMDHRSRPIADVISTGIEHKVEEHGATFAGVVLWNASGPNK
jgi:arginine decarboxylase